MNSSWDFYAALFQEEQAFVLVDSGLFGDAPLTSHPDLVVCIIPVTSVQENRFPTPEAFETIYDFEEKLTLIAGTTGAHIYVGRLGTPHKVFYHFYSNNGSALADQINASTELKAISDFDCRAVPDPEWESYLEILHPTPETRNNIENAKVCEQLLKSGDDINIERQVDHFAYFESADGLNTFKGAVDQEGYTIVNAADAPDERGLWALAFSKTQVPAELDPITWTLSELAKASEGMYDGWGCPVVKSAKVRPTALP